MRGREAYLGNCHRTRYGTNAVTDGGQETDLHAVGELEEFVDLGLSGRGSVPLFGDRGVGLGVDLFGCEFFRHVG